MPCYAGFSIFTLRANFLKLVCFNFPCAFFTQPLIRKVFGIRFRKDLQARDEEAV